jgi:hypothetical protein
MTNLLKQRKVCFPLRIRVVKGHNLLKYNLLYFSLKGVMQHQLIGVACRRLTEGNEERK